MVSLGEFGKEYLAKRTQDAATSTLLNRMLEALSLGAARRVEQISGDITIVIYFVGDDLLRIDIKRGGE